MGFGNACGRRSKEKEEEMVVVVVVRKWRKTKRLLFRYNLSPPRGRRMWNACVSSRRREEKWKKDAEWCARGRKESNVVLRRRQ